MLADGGIARLRVYGEVIPDWDNISECDQMDMVAMINGGICVDYSDAHYGHASNVIAPGRANKMSEGKCQAVQQQPCIYSFGLDLNACSMSQ